MIFPALKGIVLFSIAIFGGNVLLSRFFKKRFEELVPLTIFSYIAILYCFGFFASLNIAVWLIMCIGIFGCAYLAYSWFYKKEHEWVKQDIFTFGFFAFLFFLAFVFVTCYNKRFTVWDEFSHWGPMVKQTLSTDSFHNVPSLITFANKNYPPAIILFEYLLCKFTGVYSEKFVLMAMQIFTFAMFLPALSSIKKKKQLPIFIIVMLLFLVMPALFGLNIFYATIYIDSALAILIAFAMFLFIANEKFDRFLYIYLFTTVFITCLSKEMGMVSVLALSVCVGIDAMIKFFKKISIKAIVKENGLILLCIWVAGVMSVLTWKLENILVNSTGTFSGDGLLRSSPIELAKALLGIGNSEQFTIYQRFWNANFNIPLSIVNPSLLKFTFASASILLIGAVFLIANNIRKNNKFLAFAVSVPITLLMYNQIMLVIYIVENDYAARYLQSYDRYMLTICIAISAAMLMFAAKHFSQAKEQPDIENNSINKLNSIWIISATLIITLCTPNTLIHDMILPVQVTGNWQGGDASIFTNHERSSKMVSQELEGQNAVLQFLCPNTPGNGSVAFRYYYMPKVLAGHFSVGQPKDENDIWAHKLTAAEWSKSISDLGITHIYLSNTSPMFEKDFSLMFPKGKVTENTLYKVSEKDGLASFELVRSLE